MKSDTTAIMYLCVTQCHKLRFDMIVIIDVIMYWNDTDNYESKVINVWRYFRLLALPTFYNKHIVNYQPILPTIDRIYYQKL